MNVSIKNLVKCYGEVRALNDLSLEIADGELFFLLGPSGCGKSTLLRCIGGFEKPTSGQILFDGKDVSTLPPSDRNTAMVFQGYALWPHMTVEENVAFGLEMRKIPKAERDRRVMAALKGVQIEALGKRKPNELSGGQQQRVALARTRVVEPGCLLLDEPLANLDAKLRRDMRQEIRSLCKDNGLTGIYVTHDRQEALSMADRIAVLKDGVIQQIGTPQELYRRPVSAFIASFIGETNFVKGTVRGESDGMTQIETADGMLLAAQTGQTIGANVLLSIRPEALGYAKGDERNLLAGRITKSDYMGEIADHWAKTASGAELGFFELNPQRDLPEGTPVQLTVKPEDVVIVRED